ncbi:MAG: alkene reductase [Thermomicrobiales bacterium]
MTVESLFSPLALGPYTLAHRIVMAPLTRMRAGAGGAPRELNVEYYRQRATPGGLIVAEASPISVSAQGMPNTPGIYTPDQVAGWSVVTRAIHEVGGVVFLQLWHVGRISHSSHQPGGGAPVAPSAIPAAGNAFTASFERVPFETPRALKTAEISQVIEDYRVAARNAMAAGFDGVEIHGANGYLIEQFLHARTNTRGDAYGGSIENRSRFLLEATAAAVDVWGADRVGVRLSPFGVANDSGEADAEPLYRYAIRELAAFGLVYLHLIEPRASGSGQAEVDHAGVPLASAVFREEWPGVLIAAGNYTPESAAAAVDEGNADAVAFGRQFIANPDLPARIRAGAPLNRYHRPTFYGGDAVGYTDYPRWTA